MKRTVAAAVLTLVVAAIAAVAPAAAVAAAEVTLAGTLSVVWGDPTPDEGGGPRVLFFLALPSGETVRLDPGPRAAAVEASMAGRAGRPVTVSGAWAESLRGPGEAAVFAVSGFFGPEAPEGDAGAQLAGSQPFVSIMCKFADVAAEPRDQSYFQLLYEPLLDNFWREVSYDRINITGSASFGWFTLPQPRSAYVYDRNGDGADEADLNLLAADCTAAADSSVWFPTYVGINMMFNETLDCCAWGGGGGLTLDGVSRFWSLTWEPPWAYGHLSVIAHEMGHGFGLPHSSGMYGNVYDNVWDVMSADGLRLTHQCVPDPTWGCTPQHTNSDFKNRLDWIPSARRLTVTGYPRVIRLEKSARPGPYGYLSARIPVSHGTWVAESRLRGGYDWVLPRNGVIMHLVDASFGPGAYVYDATLNADTADSGAAWTPGETFSDPGDSLFVTVNNAYASGYQVTIDNHAPSPDDLGGAVRLRSLAAVSGVRLSVATSGYAYTIVTDKAGRYRLFLLPAGLYTVRPSKAGYRFIPSSRTVAIGAGDRLSVSFTAVPL
ncbi:MAG TPA: carboxypeptidase regulatory-like domain-containing protein [bacterium]